MTVHYSNLENLEDKIIFNPSERNDEELPLGSTKCEKCFPQNYVLH